MLGMHVGHVFKSANCKLTIVQWNEKLHFVAFITIIFDCRQNGVGLRFYGDIIMMFAIGPAFGTANLKTCFAFCESLIFFPKMYLSQKSSFTLVTLNNL